MFVHDPVAGVHGVNLALVVLAEEVHPFVSVELEGLFGAVDVDDGNGGDVAIHECLGFVEDAQQFVPVEVVVRIVPCAGDFGEVLGLVLHEPAHALGDQPARESSEQETDDQQELVDEHEEDLLEFGQLNEGGHIEGDYLIHKARIFLSEYSSTWSNW